MTTRLVAVVVTFNRLEKLRLTLERLLAEPLDHILVVDSGSTDGTREWLADLDTPRLTVLPLARNGGGALGFETGMREAMSHLSPDWLVLMDDDARPEPGAIAAFRDMDRGFDVMAAAVRFPDGRICDMNRPWINPFWQTGVFLRTLLGGGREAFHVGPADYAATGVKPIHGASFVGLFLSAETVRRCGYPDGRMFIYGDDVHYTLGLTKQGARSVFAPEIRFEHDCASIARGAVFRPLWKTYYHHRNLWRVYRRAAGPVLFWPLIALMVPKWLMKGGALPEGERAVYRRLIRLGVADAVRGNLARPHHEILRRAAVQDESAARAS